MNTNMEYTKALDIHSQIQTQLPSSDIYQKQEKDIETCWNIFCDFSIFIGVCVYIYKKAKDNNSQETKRILAKKKKNPVFSTLKSQANLQLQFQVIQTSHTLNQDVQN